MSKYISTDWIGRETSEVERYIKDKAPILANALNNFNFGVSLVAVTGVDALKVAKDSILNNTYTGNAAQQNKDNVEALISSITDMLKYSSVKEPIASVTGVYYLKNYQLNEKAGSPSRRWPFSFITVNYKTAKISSVNTSTTTPVYNQEMEVVFDYTLFLENFVRRYMRPLDRRIVSDETALRVVYSLFLISFKRMLESNTSNKFVNFNRQEVIDANQEELFSAQASTTPEYNFYIKEYEETFTKDFTSLQVLPNYYLLNTYLNTDEEQKVRDIVSLNGRINVTEQTVLSQQYYSDFTQKIKSMSRQEIDDVVNKAKNYLIDVDYANRTKIALSDEVFPYNNRLTFSNDKSDQISSFLNANNLQTLFASNVYNTLLGSSDFDTLSDPSGTFVDDIKGGYGPQTYVRYTDSIKFNYTDTSKQIGFVLLPNAKQDFISYTKNTQPSITGSQSLFTFIKMQSLLLDTFSVNADFSSLFACNPNKSFSCGYLVEKSNPSQPRNPPYQTIVMARDNVVTDYEIVDTQVTYDSAIRYTVYSLEMTTTNEYSYTIVKDELKEQKKEKKTNSFSISATLNQQLAFFKTKLYAKDATILDNPPLPVDVNIVPFIGVNNALRFLLNTQLGSYTETPVPITEDDIKLFQSIKEKRNIKGNKLFFETDDFITSVQVFRTTTIPTTYADFRNSLYLTLDLNSLTATSFIDTIIPNQKYYYTFRSLDVHNNISNPSSVFEVEIIDNDGAVYPVIRTIPLVNNKEVYDTTKSFRKYISIVPSITQTAFIPNENNTQVTFGEQQDLWDQKFKLRFTSKKTGKSFDLNLTFTKE